MSNGLFRTKRISANYLFFIFSDVVGGQPAPHVNPAFFAGAAGVGGAVSVVGAPPQQAPPAPQIAPQPYHRPTHAYQRPPVSNPDINFMILHKQLV